jgi:phosphoglycolate phosphatase
MTRGLLIFDLDNTIVHSRIDFAGIRSDLIGLGRSADALNESEHDVRARSIGQIIELIAERHEPLRGEAWDIVLRYERAGMLESTIEPEAAQALGALRQRGFAHAILTNNARAAAVAALDRFDLGGLFDLVLTRDEVAMKPDPMGITMAMRELAGAANRTAMVGDSWLDGAAADRAGVPFIAFQSRPEALAGRGVTPWRSVTRLHDLTAIVDEAWS